MVRVMEWLRPLAVAVMVTDALPAVTVRPAEKTLSMLPGIAVKFVPVETETPAGNPVMVTCTGLLNVPMVRTEIETVVE
jgi:hypothetical protein